MWNAAEDGWTFHRVRNLLSEEAPWEARGAGDDPVLPVRITYRGESRPSTPTTPGTGGPAARRGQTLLPPRVRLPGQGSPRPGSGLVGSKGRTRPPARLAHSLLSRRTAAASHHPVPGARLAKLVPGRTKVTPRAGKRPAAKPEGTHTVLVPTCHLAMAVQPQPSGRFILLREDGRLRKGRRPAKRAVTSGLLPCLILFGSVAGSAPISGTIFVKGRRRGLCGQEKPQRNALLFTL